jgi:hypothetical protein
MDFGWMIRPGGSTCGQYHLGTDQTGCVLVQISLVLCALLVSGYAAESGEFSRNFQALAKPQKRLCLPPLAVLMQKWSPTAAHRTESVARRNSL